MYITVDYVYFCLSEFIKYCRYITVETKPRLANSWYFKLMWFETHFCYFRHCLIKLFFFPQNYLFICSFVEKLNQQLVGL